MLDSKSQRTTAYRIQRPIQQGCWHGSATAKAKRNRTEASHRPIRPCSSLAPSASSFFLSSMLTYAFSVSIFILILWLFLFTLSCCSFLSTPLRLPSLLLSLVFRSLSFSLSLSRSISLFSFFLSVIDHICVILQTQSSERRRVLLSTSLPTFSTGQKLVFSTWTILLACGSVQVSAYENGNCQHNMDMDC